MSNDIERKAKEILFEHLREAKDLLSADSIISQAKLLDEVAEWFGEVAEIHGSVGYSAFSNALKVSVGLRKATQSLLKTGRLLDLLEELQKSK